MGRKYAIRNTEGIYFVTFTIVNWLDVFIRDEYREIFLDSLKHCIKEKGLRIHAYCLMTSHVHLILSVEDGYDLSSVIRDFKSYTSKMIMDSIANNQRESRREWLMWFFERAGAKNKRNGKRQFCNNIIILLNYQRMKCLTND